MLISDVNDSYTLFMMLILTNKVQFREEIGISYCS